MERLFLKKGIIISLYFCHIDRSFSVFQAPVSYGKSLYSLFSAGHYMDELLRLFVQICYAESSRNEGNFNTDDHSLSPTQLCMYPEPSRNKIYSSPNSLRTQSVGDSEGCDPIRVRNRRVCATEIEFITRQRYILFPQYITVHNFLEYFQTELQKNNCTEDLNIWSE